MGSGRGAPRPVTAAARPDDDTCARPRTQPTAGGGQMPKPAAAVWPMSRWRCPPRRVRPMNANYACLEVAAVRPHHSKADSREHYERVAQHGDGAAPAYPIPATGVRGFLLKVSRTSTGTISLAYGGAMVAQLMPLGAAPDSSPCGKYGRSRRAFCGAGSGDDALATSIRKRGRD